MKLKLLESNDELLDNEVDLTEVDDDMDELNDLSKEEVTLETINEKLDLILSLLQRNSTGRPSTLAPAIDYSEDTLMESFPSKPLMNNIPAVDPRQEMFGGATGAAFSDLGVNQLQNIPYSNVSFVSSTDENI